MFGIGRRGDHGKGLRLVEMLGWDVVRGMSDFLWKSFRDLVNRFILDMESFSF